MSASCAHAAVTIGHADARSAAPVADAGGCAARISFASSMFLPTFVLVIKLVSCLTMSLSGRKGSINCVVGVSPSAKESIL